MYATQKRPDKEEIVLLLAGSRRFRILSLFSYMKHTKYNLNLNNQNISMAFVTNFILYTKENFRTSLKCENRHSAMNVITIRLNGKDNHIVFVLLQY